jgi:uncharacterized protein (TIGR03083 family)
MAYEYIVDALESTWTSIEDLLAARPESDFDRPTPCPGWSVRDVLSHLVGFELLLRGEPVPRFEGEFPDYVKNPIGEANEAYVAVRRARPGAEVVAEFHAIGHSAIERLRALPDAEWEVVGWSPEGERPFHRFMETRIVDSWIHLQDLRDALLEPDDDHGPGEEIVVNRFESALAYLWGKRVGAPEGGVLRVNLTGRLARSVTIVVRDGKAGAVESSHVDPLVELSTPVALFWRRCAGRISAEAFLQASATDVRGDHALATSLAGHMAIMI